MTGVLALLLVPISAYSQDPERLNFLGCPIVQDTETVPCWLARYEGELYYLGIQTDISAEFDPPYLGHQVLVEGTVADGERICGGIVLDPVKTSPMPEQDLSCNLILPAVEDYTVPFAPRPPGPSGGRLAFQAPPGARQAPPAPTGSRTFVIEYDFDTPIMGRHASVLSAIAAHAEAVGSRRITITGFSGATLLTDGQTLYERDDMGEIRAREVETLLRQGGLSDLEYAVGSLAVDPVVTDGVDDWESRRTEVFVEAP